MDGPRFGDLAPATIVVLAYVPVTVAAAAKSGGGVVQPSKAGAAAERAANAADTQKKKKKKQASGANGTPSGPRTPGTPGSDADDSFVTAAAEDTLTLMELGFECVVDAWLRSSLIIHRFRLVACWSTAAATGW